MTRLERETREATLIKSLSEHYGFTPKQIGELTIFQVLALLENEDETKGETTTATTSVTSGKQTMSIAEFRRLARGQL